MNESHSESPTLSPLVAPALAAYAAELPRGRQRRDLSEFAAALARDTSPQSMAEQQPLAAAWLPRLTAASAAGRPLEPLAELFAETRSSVVIWKRWLVAASYPLLIALLAIAVATFLGIFVVPVFDELYSDWGLTLPHSTKLLIMWSQFVRGGRETHVAALLVIVVPCLLAWWAARKGALEPLIGRLLAGSLGRVADAAGLVHRIADSLEAGRSPANAVAEASAACRVAALKRAAAAWAAANGAETRAQPKDIRAMPAMLHCILDLETISPETRAAMLNALGDAYAERVDRRGGDGLGYFTPAGIAFAGGIVVLMVVALFLPMIQMIQGLTG